MTQRTVVITGAGSGLGRALAGRYAHNGWAVCCADIRVDRAEETAAALPGSGHFAAVVDVASDASFEELRESVAKRWPHLHALINNAGVASGGGLMNAPMDEWRWMLDINLLGVVRGCRSFVPWFTRQGSGHIINTASFAGLAAAPNIMTYGVAKAGVVALSEQLRAELFRRNVKVSVICPSFFKTNLAESFRGDERMKDVACKLMENARESADDIAAAVYAAAERGDFMIIPTAGERLRWRLKRWFPNYYFKKLLELTGARGAQPIGN